VVYIFLIPISFIIIMVVNRFQAIFQYAKKGKEVKCQLRAERQPSEYKIR